MRDVLGKMRECGKYIKMRDFPHDCGMVDTYGTLSLCYLIKSKRRKPATLKMNYLGNIISGATCVQQ